MKVVKNKTDKKINNKKLTINIIYIFIFLYNNFNKI